MKKISQLQQQCAESNETISAYESRFVAVREAVKERDSWNENNIQQLQFNIDKS